MAMTTKTTNKIKNNTKKNILIVGILSVITASAVTFGMIQTDAVPIQPMLDPADDRVVSRTVAPFLFELPEGTVDGARYTSIREGGMPEATLERSKTVSLPLIIRPTGSEEVRVDFYTTFGEQLEVPKMPPGVHVTLAPSTVILKPGIDSLINVNVRVDNNAPDGLYMQNIVGKWGGPNDFSGTAISLKVGNGSPQFLLPGDVGQ